MNPGPGPYTGRMFYPKADIVDVHHDIEHQGLGMWLADLFMRCPTR